MDDYEGSWVEGWDESVIILHLGDGVEGWFGKGYDWDTIDYSQPRDSYLCGDIWPNGGGDSSDVCDYVEG